MSRYDDIDAHERSTMRWVRKRGEPSSPFWPAAFWPLLGLLALSVFSCTQIQEATEDAAERALTASNLDWAEANASGRTIYLTGEAPSAEAGNKAKRAVLAVEADNWLGTDLSPAPVKVHENFTFARQLANEPEPTVDPVLPAPNPIVPPQTNVISPDWSFRLTGGTLELNGEVPTDEIRLNISQLAQSSIRPPRFNSVMDNLTVTETTPPDGYLEVARRGVNTVIQCEQGVSSFVNRRFSLTCQLPSSAIESVRAEAIAPMAFGTLGQVTMQSQEAVSACETSLQSLLENTRIQFASKSSVIDAASAPLIVSIAEQAKTCPGRLRVEGHTDSTGRDDENQALSVARAEAVRAALIEQGVAPTRLVASGFGPRRPIGDNLTSEGRAQNRRIEIKVIRPDE